MIVPVLNERQCIERTVRSLVSQHAPQLDLEFLLIDGGSRDGSREILERFARFDKRIRVMHNAKRKTPVAFNLGVRAARGEYVCILGAHAEYPVDYIQTCYDELVSHHAVGCSGRVLTRPADHTASARLVACCLAHRFASSSGSVRTQNAGCVDTIAFPIFRKSALLEVGGYDEFLERNQDNDMNHRLRARGHRLYLTDKVAASYWARPTIPALLRYAFRTGQWNALTLRHKRACLSLRHFVPLLFIATITLLMVAAAGSVLRGQSLFAPLGALGAVLGAHLMLGIAAGIESAVREHSATMLLLAPVILAFHISYGVGTAAGLFRKLPTAGTTTAVRVPEAA